MEKKRTYHWLFSCFPLENVSVLIGEKEWCQTLHYNNKNGFITKKQATNNAIELKSKVQAYNGFNLHTKDVTQNYHFI